MGAPCSFSTPAKATPRTTSTARSATSRPAASPATPARQAAASTARFSTTRNCKARYSVERCPEVLPGVGLRAADDVFGRAFRDDAAAALAALGTKIDQP